MRLTKLWILILPAICMGTRLDVVEFSVNYFKERSVPYICLLSCGNVAWNVKFAKAASFRFISVSRLEMIDLSYESMEQCFRQVYSSIGVLMDVECGNTEQIIYTASKNRWLDLKHIWLILNGLDGHINVTTSKVYEDSENFSKTIHILSNMNISVDADIIMASQLDNQFQLLDVFNFGKVQGGELIVTELEQWKPKEDNKVLFEKLNGCKFNRRYDFKELGLRIISVVTSKMFDPKMLTDVRPVQGIATVTRTSTMVLMEVAQTHNIKFIHSRTDKWLGTYESNASRAIATSLYFEEQDVSSVFRYHEFLFGRVTLINPSLTTIETRYYYRIPTTGPGKFENQFLRPLSAGTWFCLLGVSIMCTVIMVIACRLESRPMSFQYSLFSVSAIVCQQFFVDGSNDLTLKRDSTTRKMTLFVTGMACVLIYNYYTSSVVSWLLNAPPPSITSLQELVESSLEIIFEDVGYTHSWLTVPGYYFNRRNAKSEDIIRNKVLSKKRATPLFIPLEEGVAMVKAGGYAYLTEPYSAGPIVSQTFDASELCELDSLPSIDKVQLYPGVQLNSPYKEFFTWSLTRLLERGIVSCIQHRTNPVIARCEGSTPRALALGGAAPAFIMLALGFLLSVCILFVERLDYKMKLQ